MDRKQLSLLKKIYHYENGFYNPKYDRHETKIPKEVTLAELNQLENIGLKPNNFETFEHDNALGRLIGYQNNSKVNFEFVKAFFYKGIIGEFPRGRQPLMSYLFAKHLKPHKFVGKENCEVCGLPYKKTVDKTDKLFTYYLGHSWNEASISFLIDLDEIQKFEQSEIINTDKQALINLLKFVELADINETPGKLEKRLALSKILPNTDKYKRYGILGTLAECGILPNKLISPVYDTFIPQTERWEASRKLATSHRSDIVLPLGAWKGENGINWERYKEIFEK